MNLEFLRPEVDRHPYRVLFATVSGAHLYGFPSPDSDWDLRGVHVAPAREVVGLGRARDTVEVARKEATLELDLVTHDVRKLILMLLGRNGYVLEQLLSPLVVASSPEHEELKYLSRGCITRHHVHHYKGFAHTQWELFDKKNPRRVKPLLYVYRVLLTGIWLMRTGEVQSNLVTLNQEFRLPWIRDLVARKTSGAERQTVEADDRDFHEREVQRLVAELTRAAEESSLPAVPSVRSELDDLLIRIRLGDS